MMILEAFQYPTRLGRAASVPGGPFLSENGKEPGPSARLPDILCGAVPPARGHAQTRPHHPPKGGS